MRALLIVMAALMSGLFAGYAWSALSPAKAHVHVPKAVDATPPVPLPTETDVQWAMRARDESSPKVEQAAPDPAQDRQAVQESVSYGNCAEVRATGHAPLHQGEPGYRSGLDADGDGTACDLYAPS